MSWGRGWPAIARGNKIATTKCTESIDSTLEGHGVISERGWHSMLETCGNLLLCSLPLYYHRRAQSPTPTSCLRLSRAWNHNPSCKLARKVWAWILSLRAKQQTTMAEVATDRVSDRQWHQEFSNFGVSPLLLSWQFPRTGCSNSCEGGLVFSQSLTLASELGWWGGDPHFSACSASFATGPEPLRRYSLADLGGMTKSHGLARNSANNPPMSDERKSKQDLETTNTTCAVWDKGRYYLFLQVKVALLLVAHYLPIILCPMALCEAPPSSILSHLHPIAFSSSSSCYSNLVSLMTAIPSSTPLFSCLYGHSPAISTVSLVFDSAGLVRQS